MANLTPELSALWRWVRYRSAAYLRGRGLVWGFDFELFPSNAVAPGVYAIYAGIKRNPHIPIFDASVEALADNAFDYVAVGAQLGTMPDAMGTLGEIVKKLKQGGHLILLLPIGSTEPGTVTTFQPPLTREVVGSLGSWRSKALHERDGWLLQIYKKQLGPRGIIDPPPPSRPRACVVRYGAIGDLIIVTPLLRELAQDGYEVTVNTSPYPVSVLAHNPNVHNLIVQERDVIPNPALGEYWKEWAGEYDRYINLSESIEGSLLKTEGRRDFYTHQSWRHQRCNVNYYDRTMERGGYPDSKGRCGELFFSSEEEREARSFRRQWRDRFLVLWALNGSSNHKIYALFEPVVSEWLDAHEDAVVVTVGDQRAKALEFQHPRLIPRAACFPLRKSLCLTKHADLVVGPETGILNAAACFPTPKIVFLSHSTHENLCKHWTNHTCLTPNAEVAPCYPCHQLHYDRLPDGTACPSCPLKDITHSDTGETLATGIPACSVGIPGETVLTALNSAYERWKAVNGSIVIAS